MNASEIKPKEDMQLAEGARPNKHEFERILDGWDEPIFENSAWEIDRWRDDGGRG